MIRAAIVFFAGGLLYLIVAAQPDRVVISGDDIKQIRREPSRPSAGVSYHSAGPYMPACTVFVGGGGGGAGGPAYTSTTYTVTK